LNAIKDMKEWLSDTRGKMERSYRWFETAITFMEKARDIAEKKIIKL
jgi:pterin-4a-carbinolamine dehydratase